MPTIHHNPSAYRPPRHPSRTLPQRLDDTCPSQDAVGQDKAQSAPPRARGAEGRATPPSARFAVAGLALLALLVIPVMRGVARAEDGLTAAQVAARVQSFYDQTKTVAADFHQTYVHKLYDRVDRSHGHVRFKKPGRMRWDYAEPNGKVIVSNGDRLIVYEPGDDGASGQMYSQPIENAELPQALSFLTGTGRLEEDFHFRLLDAKRQGFPSGHVLELRPKQPNPHYKRILFYVERHEKLAGLVRRVLIVDHSGNRNRFDFKNLRFNREIPASVFEWTPPKGTRRIQP